MWRTCQAAWAAAHAPTSASASRSCRARWCRRLPPRPVVKSSCARMSGRRVAARLQTLVDTLWAGKKGTARACALHVGVSVCLSVCRSRMPPPCRLKDLIHCHACASRELLAHLAAERARPAGGRASPRAGAATPAGAPLPCLCSGRSHPCHAHLGGWGAREAGGGRRPDRSHAAAPLAALGVAGRADPSLSGCCGCPLNCRPPRDAGRGELAGVGDAAGAAGGTDPTAAG